MQLNNQHGFTLVQAIFVLVVLALLGTYMVRLSTVQQATATQSLIQARVYHAARSGLEWGIKQVSDNHGCFSNSTFNIDAYPVQMVCTLTGTYSEGVSTYGVYKLQSVASFADISSPDYVSRKLEVTIHD